MKMLRGLGKSCGGYLEFVVSRLHVLKFCAGGLLRAGGNIEFSSYGEEPDFCGISQGQAPGVEKMDFEKDTVGLDLRGVRRVRGILET
jgi:hypothetical protein